MITAVRTIFTICVFLIVTASFAQQHANRTDAKGRQGIWKVWLSRNYEESDDSTIAPYYRITSYKNNLALGPFKEYDRTGVLHREGTFKTKEGRVFIEGTVKKYRENGSLEIVEEYINGTRHGSHVKYSINGTVTTKGQYDYGRRSGEWKTYYESGELKSQGSYEGGDQDGAWTTYLENGTIKDVTLFDHGRPVDWNELLNRAEKSINAGRTEDASRSINAASDLIQSAFGSTSAPAARLQFVTARYEASNGRSRSAIKHIDTAVSICTAIGASARSTLHAGLDKTTSYAFGHSDMVILDHVIPIVRAENRRPEPTTLYYTRSFATTEIQYACGKRDSLLAEQAIKHAALRIRLATIDTSVESTKESFDYWLNTAENLLRFRYPIQAKQCLDIGRLDEQHLSADVADSIRSEYAAIELYTIAFDYPRTQSDRIQGILSYLDKYKDGDRSKFCYLLLDAAVCFSSREMAIGIADRCTDDCLEVIPSKQSVMLHVMIALAAIERHECDKAKLHLDNAVRKNSHSVAYEVLTQLRTQVSQCSDMQGTDSIPSVPPLFARHNDTTASSFEAAIRSIIPGRADIYLRALAPTATGEDMLVALINADTLVSDFDVQPYDSAYQVILEKTKPLVARHRDHVQRASSLFKALHELVLVKYVENIPLRSIFTNGHFNCASSVALYGMLCRDLDIPIIYYDAPYHIACGIPDNGKVLLVELTSPTKGFDFTQQRDSVLQLLREYKFVTQEEYDEMGADSVYRSYLEHRRVTSFECVLRAALINTQYRNQSAYLDGSHQDTEHVLLPLILDSAAEKFSLFYSMMLTSDTADHQRMIDGVSTLNRYYHGNAKFFSTFVIPWLRMAQIVKERDLSIDLDPLYQSVYDHAPLENDRELSTTFSTLVAANRAANARARGHLDTAYAYLATHTPDSLRTWDQSYYGLAGEYVEELIAQSRYDLAQRIVRQELNANRNRSSRALFCFSTLQILSSQAIRTMKLSDFSARLDEVYREFALLEPDAKLAGEHVAWQVNRSVLFNCHEFGAIACSTARRYRLGLDVLPTMESSIRVMQANRDLDIDLDEVTIKPSIRIGSGDGPETNIISGLNALMCLHLEIDGLKIGQVVTIDSEFQGGGDVPGSTPTMQFGAFETSMRFWVDIPQAVYRSRNGPVKIKVRVNGADIDTLAVSVQP